MVIEPNLKEFKAELKRADIVALCMALPADLETPVSVFLKLARDKQDAFLLESVELGEQLGRFSMFGMDPEFSVEHQNGVSTITRGNVRKSQRNGLLEVIAQLLKQYRFSGARKLPALVGSLVGFIGYELVQEFEDVRLKPKKGLPVPDAFLMFPTNLVVFDHIKHELKLVHLALKRPNVSAEKLYQHAVEQLIAMRHQLNQPAKIKSGIKKTSAAKQLNSNLSKSQFESLVKRAKEYIRAGDCIQIVLSQRFDLGTVEDAFLVYRNLRSLNPSPYMFYLKHKELTLVGSSPEVLVKKTGLVAETRPIAGTRPRGKNAKEDLANEAALKASKKEMAEHLMLVDLGRNDLGRVSDPKSVKVANFAHVERYSHVMHLVSEVTSVLKKNKTAFDLLKASFPAGTVTGAPKIRAMQIIDELERERRGPYAGSFGYFSLNGDMDMCITIRTIVVNHGKASVQAGAGIVNDSVPSKEYQETINKAKALMQAVQTSDI